MWSGGAGGSNETPGAQSNHHGHRTTGGAASRRIFAIGSYRFQCSRRRLVDVILDCASFAVEGFVYVIGPMLILLALGIISLLAYTFFQIVLPMMHGRLAGNPYRNVVLTMHVVWVIFLIGNVLFNYACCVLQKHTGPHYDQVVAELAEATEFPLPRTPEELAVFRRDLNDRLVIRMRRRNARAAAAAAATDESSVDEESNAMPLTKRRHGGRNHNNNNNASASTTTTTTQQQQSSSSASLNNSMPKVRSWMLMGPFEWGYCANSNQPKPPRSHFDHVSKSLVLNLDHYCPWMFNAIGYFNYRYFVNFLIFIFVGMSYGASILLEPFLLAKSTDYRKQVALQKAAIKQGLTAERLKPMMPLREEKMLVTLSFMLCAAVGIAVVMLGGFHIYLTLTAQTTIEFHGNIAQRKRARAAGQKWKNPYSRGSSKGNWQQVYGTRYSWLLLSLLPSRREPEFLPVPVPGRSGRRKQALSSCESNGRVSDDGISCELSRTPGERDRLLTAQVNTV